MPAVFVVGVIVALADLLFALQRGFGTLGLYGAVASSDSVSAMGVTSAARTFSFSLIRA